MALLLSNEDSYASSSTLMKNVIALSAEARLGYEALTAFDAASETALCALNAYEQSLELQLQQQLQLELQQKMLPTNHEECEPSDRTALSGSKRNAAAAFGVCSDASSAASSSSSKLSTDLLHIQSLRSSLWDSKNHLLPHLSFRKTIETTLVDIDNALEHAITEFEHDGDASWSPFSIPAQGAALNSYLTRARALHQAGSAHVAPRLQSAQIFSRMSQLTALLSLVDDNLAEVLIAWPSPALPSVSGSDALVALLRRAVRLRMVPVVHALRPHVPVDAVLTLVFETVERAMELYSLPFLSYAVVQLDVLSALLGFDSDSKSDSLFPSDSASSSASCSASSSTSLTQSLDSIACIDKTLDLMFASEMTTQPTMLSCLLRDARFKNRVGVVAAKHAALDLHTWWTAFACESVTTVESLVSIPALHASFRRGGLELLKRMYFLAQVQKEASVQPALFVWVLEFLCVWTSLHRVSFSMFGIIAEVVQSQYIKQHPAVEPSLEQLSLEQHLAVEPSWDAMTTQLMKVFIVPWMFTNAHNTLMVFVQHLIANYSPAFDSIIVAIFSAARMHASQVWFYNVFHIALSANNKLALHFLLEGPKPLLHFKELRYDLAIMIKVSDPTKKTEMLRDLRTLHNYSLVHHPSDDVECVLGATGGSALSGALMAVVQQTWCGYAKDILPVILSHSSMCTADVREAFLHACVKGSVESVKYFLDYEPARIDKETLKLALNSVTLVPKKSRVSLMIQGKLNA